MFPPGASAGLKSLNPGGIASFLRSREQGGVRTLLAAEKQVFAHVYPTDTLYNVETPPNVLRKFSPDGKIIVASAVSSEQSEPSQSQPPSSMGIDDLHDLDDITFWLLDLDTGKTYRNDFIYLNHNAGVHLFIDTLGITSVKNQCIYMLHVMDAGTFVHVRTLGCYTYDDDELVISAYHDAERSYRKRKRCQEDEEASDGVPFGRGVRQSDLRDLSTETPPAQVVPPSPLPHPIFQPLVPSVFRESCGPQEVENTAMPLSGLKHRMMTFLYRKAQASGRKSAMHHFHRTFDRFASLSMWRMQFLDADNIMIKFGETNAVIGAAFDLKVDMQTCFFVMYRLSTTEVYGVYDNASPELYEMVESDPRFFGTPTASSLHLSTPPTSLFAREGLRRFFRTVEKARNGGYILAIKQLLSQLPFNNQCFIETPYLNEDIFSYDSRAISNYDRPRPACEFPARFFDRISGAYRFSIDSSPCPGHVENAASK
ncbi:acid phosphatase det1 [Geranomyces variabilis]|uniref:Acid phosphatase det1 n=1 Tax=Geranomyces variabilis TaxID=109894 RepID=A0AAD5TF68_9FUNG|nr:acid phosphatase det1 [Geranomyces variabilis]